MFITVMSQDIIKEDNNNQHERMAVKTGEKQMTLLRFWVQSR